MNEAQNTRSRRENASKKQTGRLSALEKLKKVRGGETKLRLDIQEEEDVYDYVDEDKYAEIVTNRRKDDWIEDDGVDSYVEDGREIFDDEYEEDLGQRSNHRNEKKESYSLKEKKPKKGTLKSFFQSSVNQNKREEEKKSIDLEKDVLLNTLLASVNNNTKLNEKLTSLKPLKLTKRKQPPANSCSSQVANHSECHSPPFKKRSLNYSIDEKELNEIFHVKQEQIDDCFEKEQDTLKANQIVDQQLNIGDSNQWSPQTVNEENKPDYSTHVEGELTNGLEVFNDEKTDEKYIKFFWLDAHDAWTPGSVYFFGKVYLSNLKKHVSCCLTLNNIEKRLYVLPREYFKSNENRKVTIQDVYNEFNDTICKKYKISNFRSKPVQKLYAFEKNNVSRKHEYLEILCSSHNFHLPTDLEGETFSTVFGANQSSLERVMLDLKLKGPSWIKVYSPKNSSPPVSWCKIELIVENFAKQMFEINSENQTLPPLTFVSLKVKTYNNVETKHKEVIGISCLCNSKYQINTGNVSNYDDHFYIICKPSNNSGLSLPYNFNANQIKSYKKTKIFLMNNEREMLNFFMAKFHQIDPDIIIGHDLQYFDLDVLLSRLNHFKQVTWSKLGRLRRTTLPYTSNSHSKDKIPLTVGRLVCDTKISSKDLIRLKEYELSELVKEILKKTRFEIDPKILPMFYASNEQIFRLINFIMMDNEFILQITSELNIFPLALQLTKIAGNILSRTLVSGRSERNEYLLLHAFSEKNYICPDKNSNKKHAHQESEDNVEGNTGGKKKPAYLGGLVLEPKIGFYDQFILLMDFNSLYPSIIQEYNICFTTISNDFELDENLLASTEVNTIASLPSSTMPDGILPVEIRKLVEKRRIVKKLLLQQDLSPELKLRYDVEQKALKLTANSMYGCLGFTKSRFYAKKLASLITYKGREVLMKTKSLVESLGFEVIYGDTDSIMINTNCTDFEKARQIGNKIQSEINGLFKLLEIEIDGVFARMLLLKKKKYATLTVSEKMIKGNQKVIKYNKELKGLDIVRRDWSIIAKKVGEQVLDFILSIDKSLETVLEEIHKYLKTIAESIELFPIEDFIINKQLTKDPEEYNDKKSLTHVLVALACNKNERMEKKFRAGDTVPYIVCKKESNGDEFNSLPATQRAFHPDELKENSDIKIDFKYYLTQQLFPVVSRLCDTFEGTSRYIIAELLGIEDTVEANRRREDELNLENLFIDEDKGFSRFASCNSIKFTCPNKSCSKIIEIRQVFDDLKENENFTLQLAKCLHCSLEFDGEYYINYFSNHLTKYLDNMINEFNLGWMSCDDPVCHFRTRLSTYKRTRKGPVCPSCRDGTLYFDISDHQIYSQILFTVHVFDIDEALKSIKNPDHLKKANENSKDYIGLYNKLKSIALIYKSYSSYNEVNLSDLFQNQFFNHQQNNFIKSMNL